MRKRHAYILMLGDQGALLYPPAHLTHNAKPLFAATHSDEDIKPLLNLLRLAPKRPIHILADLRTLNLKLDTIPKLSFFDRRKLIARRLTQTFPKTTLRTAIKHSDQQQLLLSLDQSDILKTWQDRLATLPNPCSGISPLPCELVSLLQTLAPTAPHGWQLLLTYHQTSGFRQIVTHNNKLIFTRLTPTPPETTNIDLLHDNLSQDIKATRDYLGRFGLAQNMPLSVVAILPHALKETCRNAPLYNGDELILTPQEAAAHVRLNMPLNIGHDSGDMVSLLWAKRGSKWQTILMDHANKHDWQHQLAQRAGMIVASIVLGLSLLHMMVTGAGLLHNYHQAQTLQNEVRELQNEYVALKKSAALPTASLGQLQQAVEKKRFYTSKIKTPELLTTNITKIIQGQAVATSFSWQKDKANIHLRLNEADDLTRAEIIQKFDELSALLNHELKGYRTHITRYPFPNLPQDTITNKNTSTMDPVGQFTITSTNITKAQIHMEGSR